MTTENKYFGMPVLTPEITLPSSSTEHECYVPHPKKRGPTPKMPKLTPEVPIAATTVPVAAASVETSSTCAEEKKDVKKTETSDSDSDDEPPSRERRKRLKQHILRYLSEKPPSVWLQVRAELMRLRDRDEYFQVTKLIPMTAGMMEQTFCRDLK